ncbi:MAG: hypothetical protein IKH75_01065 [Ruminococcus sp.]|nr:hypothetical protein [Ruminococcus sp.]
MAEEKKNPTFNIYCMSYRRPNEIKTKHLLEYCTYVVREEEAEAYRASGIDDMLVIPDGAVKSFMSTLYWIIENAPEDVLFIADDDIERFVYRMNDTTNIEDDMGEPDKETATAEIERVAQLMVDLKVGYAFDQPTLAPYAYDCEFKFVGMPGHIRWINKLALKATYDPHDPAASDVDMMMQELLKNRIILQPRYLCAKAMMDLNEGATRTRQGHLALIESMKNKWGAYYDYNLKRNVARINVKR